MIRLEDPLAEAERLVREAEERVTGKRALSDRLEQDGHPELAVSARAVLAVYERTLELLREHLHLERQARGLES